LRPRRRTALLVRDRGSAETPQRARDPTCGPGRRWSVPRSSCAGCARASGRGKLGRAIRGIAVFPAKHRERVRFDRGIPNARRGSSRRGAPGPAPRPSGRKQTRNHESRSRARPRRARSHFGTGCVGGRPTSRRETGRVCDSFAKACTCPGDGRSTRSSTVRSSTRVHAKHKARVGPAAPGSEAV